MASSASVLPNTVHGRTHSVLDAIARTEEEAFIIAHTLAGYSHLPRTWQGKSVRFGNRRGARMSVVSGCVQSADRLVRAAAAAIARQWGWARHARR